MALPNPSDSQSALELSVPGKAMLFGEYGVLSGGRAVAVLLGDFRMALEFSWCSPQPRAGVFFESDFLERPVSLAVADLSSFSTQRDAEILNPNFNAREKRNLSCYVSGYSDFLRNYLLTARVKKSFSPQFGFGSSSALLVAFQSALFHFFCRENILNERYWDNLYAALLMLQKKGSGYDVAVQSWAVAQEQNLGVNGAGSVSARIVLFENKEIQQNKFRPEVRLLPLERCVLRRFGCFVQTGVYSNTRAVLDSSARLLRSEPFISQQRRWADAFIDEPTYEHCQDLCRASSQQARELGLLPQTSDVLAFVNACDAENIAWKTMGAGHGDCLWVMASRECINELISRTGAASLSVCFAFSEGV
jgi:mevalonate kinase